ncbi:uncharacterized protein LOC143063291 isoform X2 [Mytilus galloprovincialis]|uniref:uncharacterized protein LOC143063291 isoform X2 n=1 Tax=Mytilus galloprovincialis TaxID=29158 RepID=UPI003F7BB550
MDTIMDMALLIIGIACFLPNVIFIQATVTTCGTRHCAAHMYCELLVNSGGLQGQCQTSTWLVGHMHTTTLQSCTATGADKNHCYCVSQACVTSAKEYYALHHQNLHCGSHSCDDYCLISDHGRTLRCANNNLHKSGCSPSHDANTVCYCSTQKCIDSYLSIVKEHTDRHVTCGNHTCHVHSGDVCVLTNDGHPHNYHGHVSSINLSCQKEGTHLHSSQRCVAPPHHRRSCSCVNQPCIESFSADLIPTTTVSTRSPDSCSDIPAKTIHRCAGYQSQLHMCESTNAVVHSIAAGDCKTFCLLCRATTTTAPTTTTAATTVPVTTIKTTTVTTQQTTTLPTTTVVYPACVQTNCAHLYLRYCHLYQTNNVIEGRCMPFQVGAVCSNYTEIQDNGCTCETTECAINILAEYSHHMGPISTTMLPPDTTMKSISTTVDGYECFGRICSSTNSYCHVYEYLDHLDARCMPFNTWSECKVYTDLHGSGCSCTSKTCSESVVKDYVNHISMTTSGQSNTATTISSTRLSTKSSTTISPTTISPTTISPTTISPTTISSTTISPTTISSTTISPTTISPKTGLHCFKTTCAVNEVCRVYLDNENSYAGYCILKNVDDLLICESSTLTISTECDCALQSCIDSFTVSKSTNTHPTTTIQTLSPQEPLIISHVPSSESTTTTISASSQTQPLICHDKPGVDCLLLNTTNICANPFSHLYCAKFCGHCTRVIESAFG